MFFGLTVEKLLLIAFIAAMVIGPERLPAAAAALGALVRRVKEFTTSGSQRLKDELGPEFADTDWRTLDPCQYDPRRLSGMRWLTTQSRAPRRR